jgi:8-oxo-dGTP diphosphatase
MAKQVAIAVVEHEDHFLVGIREVGITLAGFAEFPGGKVEANESAEDAAVRECREETGLEVNVVRLLHQIEFDYPNGLLHISFYLCKPRTDGNPFDDPLIGSFRWVTKNELATLKFPPANDELLAILLSPQLGIK